MTSEYVEQYIAESYTDELLSIITKCDERLQKLGMNANVIVLEKLEKLLKECNGCKEVPLIQEFKAVKKGYLYIEFISGKYKYRMNFAQNGHKFKYWENKWTWYTFVNDNDVWYIDGRDWNCRGPPRILPREELTDKNILYFAPLLHHMEELENLYNRCMNPKNMDSMIIQ